MSVANLVDLSIVLLLILINGLFVMSEMSIISAKKVRLQQMASQKNNKRAQTALELANSPNRFLPTVQVGITLMAILSGARGEQAIGLQLEPLFKSITAIPFLQTYSEIIASTIAILIVTYLSLIIGELVPKQLALNFPEKIALLLSLPLNSLTKISAPINKLLNYSSDFLVRLMGIQPATDEGLTEEEIKLLIDEVGTLNETEQDMMQSVLKLDDRVVSSLMTPRPEIVWLDLNDSLDENRQKISQSSYSRFPVCDGELDLVLGVVHVTDLLSQTLAGQDFDLTTILKKPHYLPESTKGLKVLESFKESSNHFALVVDEYGVIQGIVTVNDLLMEIIGDIPNQQQPESPQAIQREDGSWLIDGMLSIEEFMELFEIPEDSVEKDRSYQTIAGFVITHLGKIPTAADHFEWLELRIEVVDMDGNRVDKILVNRL